MVFLSMGKNVKIKHFLVKYRLRTLCEAIRFGLVLNYTKYFELIFLNAYLRIKMRQIKCYREKTK